MDVITQGLLGGVLAQSAASKNETKTASLIGVIAGLLADADILIYSANDPLLNIEYHRHFTHSLLFIPVGAAIAMTLMWPFLRNRISTGRFYLFCLLGYCMSGVIDACTSYGTHLFWPFTNERVAWNIISIVDPLFTLILLTVFILGLKVKLRKVAYLGLALSVGYMALGFFQLQRAEDIANKLAASRGHKIARHVVKPTLANLVLWRSTYIHEQHIYVDAIRLGVFDDDRIYQGESVRQFRLDVDMPNLDKQSALHQDIERFRVFSDDFIAYDPTQDNVIGDIRYSMLPISTKPLWGIVINQAKPHVHAEYRFYRDNSPGLRNTFLNMLLGKCLKDECL
jgi:inner membrane protein